MKGILIKNISEETSQKVLITYFSQFGKIKKVTVKRLSPNYIYAEVFVLDKYSYDLILNTEHYIQKRKVKVLPFTDEEFSLMMKDWEITQRRVCVFGIPKTYNNKKFKQIFIERFGSIENAYVRKNRSKEYNYGFVTFPNKELARYALKLKFLSFYDQEDQLDIFMEIREFNSKGVSSKGKNKGKEVDDEIVYLEEKKLIYPKNNEFFDRIFNERSPYDSTKNTINKKSKINFPSSIPPKYLKDYLYNILKRNHQIKGFTKNDILSLELFFYNYTYKNGSFIKNFYNYDSVAFRFSKKIEGNHYQENLRTNGGFTKTKRKFCISQNSGSYDSYC